MESTSEVVPCTVDDKSVCVEELPENTKTEKQSVEEDVTTTTITLKKHVDEDKTNVADKAVEKSVEQSESEEIEEVVEEIEESGDDENLAEDVNQKITEEVDDTPDGGQTKTITTTTVKEEQPNSITKTVVTSTIVTKETPTTTTTITEIPPTTEEIKVQTTKIVETSSKEVALEEKKSEKNEGDENDKVEQQDEEDEEDEEFEEEEEEEEEEKVEDKEENVKQEDNKKFVKDESSQQQLNNDQTPQEAESKPTQQEAHINKQTVVDAPSVAPPKDQHETNKQENLNNTIKNIISSIDSNIQAEENIAALKERELELLKKQQELAKEIEQQKLLAQKLASENQLKQQFNNNFTHRESSIPLQSYQPTKNVSKYSTFEENQDENVYSRKSETFETMESTNVSKKIDLHKIFTPATDAAEILPKNRKLYASSAFYSPSLHPTVEDQVELARRISHSLSDISNQQSRGQSMYVNRKKRSVKWVHEGCGQDYHQYQQQPRPSTSPSILPAYTDAAKHRVQLNLHQEQLLEKYAKPGLKVVQTPWEAALNSGSASAAFVEEQKLSPYSGSVLTPSPTPQLYDASQGGAPLQSSPTAHDRYSKPYSSADGYQKYPTQTATLQQAQHERQQYTGTNLQRELAYKPSIPQGWKAPSMSLPKDLYMPKEIPLQSYAPPPVAAIPFPAPSFSTNTDYETNQNNSYKPLSASPLEPYSLPEYTPTMNKPYGGGSNTFPISKPNQQGFSLTYGHQSNQPPKQQYLPPQSYQKIPQNTSQNIPQVSFNPSPLPYDKLAKFENPPSDEGRYINSPTSRGSNLNVRGSRVRNTSPAPFAGSYNRAYTPSCDAHHYGDTPSTSPRPLSSMQQNSGYNSPHLSHPSVSSTQILNAPSYNTSARGWGHNGGASTGYKYPQSQILATRPQIVNAASMPYTDF